MKIRTLQWVVVVGLSVLFVATAGAGHGKGAARKAIVVTPDQLQWKEGPAVLNGAQVAVLEGDPAKKGFFVSRLKIPAGTKIPAHFHNNVERVTVLSGKVYLSMGETRESPVELPAGSYFSLPPKTVHNAWVDQETVLQISTNGPWSMQVEKGAHGKPRGSDRER